MAILQQQYLIKIPRLYSYVIPNVVSHTGKDSSSSIVHIASQNILLLIIIDKVLAPGKISEQPTPDEEVVSFGLGVLISGKDGQSSIIIFPNVLQSKFSQNP